MSKSIYLRISIAVNILLAFVIILFFFKKEVSNLIKKRIALQDVEIVMFGNSITAYGNWNELLDRQDVLNKGFPGYTSSHLVLLNDSHLIKHKPTICFIMIGINDIQVGIPSQRTRSNYINILEKMRENDIIPVVQSTLYKVNHPESKTLVDSLNNFLNYYCIQNDIKFLNLNNTLSATTGLKPEYSVDGLHLNQKAYLAWAIEVKKVLEIIEGSQN